MFISTRNSGATYIMFEPFIELEILLKIFDLPYESQSSEISRKLAEPQNIESFVLLPETVKTIHLTNAGSSWKKDNKVYVIHINTLYGLYRLGYGDTNPGFLKKLLQYVYPDIMSKQVEELI